MPCVFYKVPYVFSEVALALPKLGFSPCFRTRKITYIALSIHRHARRQVLLLFASFANKVAFS